MKKIILFIFTLFLITTKVNAATFRMGEKLNPLFYVQRTDGTRTHNGLLFKLLRDDNEFVYCIEPFETRVSNIEYTEYNYNNSVFGIDDEALNMLNLIAYYGYGYNDHTDIKWYGITQLLIWRHLSPIYDVFLTDKLYGNEIEPYKNEIREIYSLVDRYYVQPSFSGKTITYTKNSTYELMDTNNVLESYDILDTNIDVSKEDNKLIINTKEDGIYKISLIKRSPIERDYKLYYGKNTQNFIYPGKINDITVEVTIKVITGEIIINKIGTSSSTSSTLGGAIYGVFQNDLQVGSITTDNNGVGSIDNIPVGNYIVKEIVPSTGYLLDETIFNVEITEKNRTVNLESYEDLIYNDLLINKYYGDNKEDGAVFEIYDSNNMLYKTIETNNGVINIKLPYGNYKVVQTKGIEGYTLVEPFDISITETSINEYDLYDELIYGNLVINKYYGEENNYIKEDGAIFKVSNETNNYEGVTNNGKLSMELPYGNYQVTQLKGIDGYSYVDDFNISITSSDSNYDLYDEIIVKVPNTGIKRKINYIFIVYIFIGLSLIIFSTKRLKE